MAHASTTLGRLEASVQRLTGRTPDELRRTPMNILRRQVEKFQGRPTQVVGAGSSSILNSSQVDTLLASALR